MITYFAFDTSSFLIVKTNLILCLNKKKRFYYSTTYLATYLYYKRWNATVNAYFRNNYNPFIFASFQMASISSKVISFRFLPCLMVCSSR